MENFPLIVVYFLVGIYVLITIIAIPVQYLYVKSLVEMKKKSNGDIVNSVGIGDISIHLNAFGNILILPATLIAMVMYKKRHKENG